MTKTLNHIIFFLHQNQNIFFSNIGNQNIFLEEKHNPPPPFQVKWPVPNINKERNSKLLARTHNFNGFILPGIEIPDFADYRTGNIHSLLKVKCKSSIEISRIPPKLKMLTGTYILQTIRTKMYGDEDAKCQLCKVEPQALGYTLWFSLFIKIKYFTFSASILTFSTQNHLNLMQFTHFDIL